MEDKHYLEHTALNLRTHMKSISNVCDLMQMTLEDEHRTVVT